MGQICPHPSSPCVVPVATESNNFAPFATADFVYHVGEPTRTQAQNPQESLYMRFVRVKKWMRPTSEIDDNIINHLFGVTKKAGGIFPGGIFLGGYFQGGFFWEGYFRNPFGTGQNRQEIIFIYLYSYTIIRRNIYAAFMHFFLWSSLFLLV